jgi:hypothetical protein
MTDSSRPEYWDDELAALWGKRFTQTENALVSDSLPLFAGKENWHIWRKT